MGSSDRQSMYRVNKLPALQIESSKQNDYYLSDNKRAAAGIRIADLQDRKQARYQLGHACSLIFVNVIVLDVIK